MIGFLSGKLLQVDGNTVLLDVAGVGYLVRIVPEQTANLVVGESLKLFIHTHVREDELALFGFVDIATLKVFKLLITVSGVGPKMAMNIISHGSAGEIQRAVAEANVSFFTAVSGIGKKNGQRIIVDLKSKLGSIAELDLSEPDSGTDEVFDALVAMGFEGRKVTKILAQLDNELSEAQKLKKAINDLSK